MNTLNVFFSELNTIDRLFMQGEGGKEAVVTSFAIKGLPFNRIYTWYIKILVNVYL